MTNFYPKYCFGFTLVLLTITKLFASESISQKLQPSPFMQQEAKWLVQALQQAHFNKVSVKQLEPKQFLNSYINKLDKQKLYFTEPEINDFIKAYAPTLITFFEQGNLFPGFEIYNIYKEKSLNRLDWVLKRLTSDFNFDSNMSYDTNRDIIKWEQSQESLDISWNKLLKYEVLSEVLSKIETNSSNPDKYLQGLDKIINESKDLVGKRYSRWKKNITDFEPTDVQELYLTTLTQMFDPHTTFMNIKEKEKFDQAMNNELVGIGAVLTTDENGYCTIRELLPGGPAEASRELESEDIILKVAQAQGEFTDVVDMKISKIVELIKGPKDTLVRLEIKPIKDPKTTKIVRIIRDKIKLTSNLATASIYKVKNTKSERNIGVVTLHSFYGSGGSGPKATDDVEELITKLKQENTEGLILDLRRNGGGYLSEAVNLAGLFISRGPVVQVKSTDGKIRKKFDFNPKLAWDLPLIVLVSRYSASASEIVAGALQNHKRAIIVGDKNTHGKGTVQSLIQMNLPFNYSVSNGKKSAAKITIQKYYLPSGRSTQIQGVLSDINMPTINEFLPIGESDLDNALPCDSISAVNFRRPANEFTYQDSNVKKLKDKSLERQENLPEFIYLNDNVNWYKTKRDETLISLNLAKRIVQKRDDQNFTSELSSQFDKLSKISFDKKEISLNIVKDQMQKSKEIRGDKNLDNNASISFIKGPNLDIRLHETCRIMSDWLNIIEQKQVSRKSSQEI